MDFWGVRRLGLRVEGAWGFRILVCFGLRFIFRALLWYTSMGP